MLLNLGQNNLNILINHVTNPIAMILLILYSKQAQDASSITFLALDKQVVNRDIFQIILTKKSDR